VNPAPRSNSRTGCAAVAALLTLGCRSVTEREVALALSARGLPGAGAGVELSQCMFEGEDGRIDLELGIERQELPDEGPAGDDWTRVWAGLRGAASADGSGFQADAGVTWLRCEGETSELSDPGDYGGGYLGLGWLFTLTPALDTGPDLSFLYVDAEGDRSGSGGVFEVAWRFVWNL
jgi:hypothetical protein